MNYIELINQFWKLNKEYSFTSNEIATYFGLLNICNELGWKNPFNQSNLRMGTSIGISEPTFIKARNTLKTKGLLDFKSDVGRRKNTSYTLKYLNKLSNTQGIYEGISKSNTVEKALDYIKPKPNKTKKEIPTPEEFMLYAKSIAVYHSGYDYSLTAKYEDWLARDWKDGNNQPITHWKTKLKNNFPYLKPLPVGIGNEAVEEKKTYAE